MKSTITITIIAMVLFIECPLAQAWECQQQLDEAGPQIRELQQPIARLTLPKLTGILKTGVSQHVAERICQDRNMHLPTARELALIAQYEHGAEGISETEQDGYYLVEGSDRGGNPDHFYFSYKGYKRPAGNLGNKWFWSLSIRPDAGSFAYILYGSLGFIGIDSLNNASNLNAVRCVRSR